MFFSQLENYCDRGFVLLFIFVLFFAGIFQYAFQSLQVFFVIEDVVFYGPIVKFGSELALSDVGC